MSNYRRGLTILDVSDPNAAAENGFFDTFPSPAIDSASFNGAWGVYPFLPSRTLVVSDIENGLFVLREAEPTSGEEPGRVVAYEYPAKLVCGTQEDPKDERLAGGGYATMINIANAGDQEATFTKRLALDAPAGAPNSWETVDRRGSAAARRSARRPTAPHPRADFPGRLAGGVHRRLRRDPLDRPLEVSAVYAEQRAGSGRADRGRY